MIRRPPSYTLFLYKSLFRSRREAWPLTTWRMREFSTATPRSEEHTSELQSHHELVCRLLLEKKKKKKKKAHKIRKKRKKTNTEKQRIETYNSPTREE